VNDATERPVIDIDSRLRAALLWDRPSLLGYQDPGARQWLDALRLNFINFGQVEDEVLSLAAHVVFSSLSGDSSRRDDHRAKLREKPAGPLFERLLACTLSFAARDGLKSLLRELYDDVERISDIDLRSRLRVRLVTFALDSGERALAIEAASAAVAETSIETRLGVVARRHAASLGAEIADFNPWLTDTPSDPLLSLPWVQGAVLEATAAMAVARVERDFSGVWDSGFHVGRTKFDDLAAAHLQSEWCGDRSLRSEIGKLMASEILLDPGSDPEQAKWALTVWATEPGTKRLATISRRVGERVGPNAAKETLDSIQAAPTVSDDTTLDVASGLWDILPTNAIPELLEWVLSAAADRSEERRRGVLTGVLWREPELWVRTFLEDERRQADMVQALYPAAVEGLGHESLVRLVERVREIDGAPVDILAGLEFLADGRQVTTSEGLDPAKLLDLLEWKSTLATPEAVKEAVDRLMRWLEERGAEAARGVHGLGSYEIGQVLGRLATYLPSRSDDVVAALYRVITDERSVASWQFGAFEGLSALRRKDRLLPEEVDRLRRLEFRAGQELLGGTMSDAVLDAARLRATAPGLQVDELLRLAVYARGTDRQARLVALATFGDEPGAAPTVEWSLVGGLFDPDDSVVAVAVSSIGRRGGFSDPGASEVALSRLRELAKLASTPVRREVVVLAIKNPEMQLADLVETARKDPAWTVRREIAHADLSGENGEPD
jgi:hypothetical protein